MKKVIISIFAAILVTVLISALMPASALASTAPTVDFYTSAKDGDLLYTPNFNGDAYFTPVTTKGTMTAVVDAIDTGKVTLTSGPKGLNFWGSEVTCLPLTESTAYTVIYTATRTDVDSCLGYYVDDQHGTYGYSYNQRFMVTSSTMAGHTTMKYVDIGFKAEGDNFSLNKTSVQRYALEVNGQDCTLKMYIMDDSGKWEKIDETQSGEILVFYTDCLGLFYYVYNEAQSVTVSEVGIYRGMTISGDKLSETTKAETTKAVTTKKLETTKAPTTTNTPVGTDDPGATAAVTTNAPVITTPGGKAKSGCGSAVALGAGMYIMLAAAAFAVGRKKR